MDISHLSDPELIGLAVRCIQRLPQTPHTKRALLSMRSAMDDCVCGEVVHVPHGGAPKLVRPPYLSAELPPPAPQRIDREDKP